MADGGGTREVKDLYAVGEIPPDFHVPKNMHAWAIRRERQGRPMQAMKLEVVPTPTIASDEGVGGERGARLPGPGSRGPTALGPCDAGPPRVRARRPICRGYPRTFTELVRRVRRDEGAAAREPWVLPLLPGSSAPGSPIHCGRRPARGERWMASGGSVLSQRSSSCSAAASGVSPRASAAANPPLKASPAPVVSTTLPTLNGGT